MNVNNPTDLFSIHDLIMAIRLASDLTQTDFARKLDVVQSTISKIESKKVPDIPFGLVCTISEKFSLPIDVFQKQSLTTGLLKNPSSIAASFIPYYDDHKLFSSKTLTILFDTISELTQKDIYSQLGLKRCLFIFEDIKLNIKILKKIEKLFSEDEFLQFIDSALLRTTINPSKKLNNITYDNTCFTTNTYENFKTFEYIDAININHHLNSFILNTLYLELCIISGQRLERNYNSNMQLAVKI